MDLDEREGVVDRPRLIRLLLERDVPVGSDDDASAALGERRMPRVAQVVAERSLCGRPSPSHRARQPDASVRLDAFERPEQAVLPFFQERSDELLALLGGGPLLDANLD